ncbi:dihydrolipoamide dehydrogenase [Halogranum amylolyticum]|uniref:Dihydrolipoamide dehydrogenase n=1 Tax=Halogranum amylolyticum TaxID=660520 RepID=A0A1H8PVN4_9EURY|nr:NAD(P)/FAD-dependent oxidoreductase [Halogranum amylolyticum]SEO45717.1 dihydrolipoamide dehydrogenase [Halogranum amylolyticum]
MHVVIIGAYGSAGVAVAETLSEHVGETVDRLTLVDNGTPGGGLCILRGCMPSKEVLSAAAHRYQTRHDDRLVGDPPTIDLEETVATKDDHVLGFAEHRRAAVHRLTGREGVEFLHGTAAFVDDHTVHVADVDGEPDERELDADYVVVATGSSVNVPDLDGIDEVDYMTSDEVLDATELPDSGVVMGFGYIGMELVPYLREAGVSDLTVVEHDDRPLDEADPEFGDELLALYREEFDVEILTNTYERSLEPTEDGGVRLHVDRDGESDVVEAEQLFLFTGRRLAVDGLGLENTSISIDEGWVDDTMQSRDDDRVFVVGDVNGKEQILHVAKEQGYVAGDNILAHARGEELERYENVHHHVVFSGAAVYPYARVGYSRFAADEAGLDYHAVMREASDDGVFKTKTTPRGRAELVVDADDGTVLGYQGLHYHADVMAKTMQVAVEMELDVRDLPDRAYHPTTPEILDGLFRAATEKLDRR